jgi:hypothetical protein
MATGLKGALDMFPGACGCMHPGLRHEGTDYSVLLSEPNLVVCGSIREWLHTAVLLRTSCALHYYEGSQSLHASPADGSPDNHYSGRINALFGGRTRRGAPPLPSTCTSSTLLQPAGDWGGGYSVLVEHNHVPRLGQLANHEQ